MSDEFVKTLGLSLMIDYFNICFLCEKGRGYDLNFICRKSIAAHYANVFHELDANFDAWNVEEDDDFLWFEFDSVEDKEKVGDYFAQFNHFNRKSALIAMPDLYEGAAHPKVEICDYYLDVIEGFIENDFQNSIAIPVGVCEDDPKVRMFMLYDSDGMRGLYKGTQILENSPARFIS